MHHPILSGSQVSLYCATAGRAVSFARFCEPKKINVYVYVCTVPYRAVPCRTVPCRVVPCRAVPYRAVSYRAVPYHMCACAPGPSDDPQPTQHPIVSRLSAAFSRTTHRHNSTNHGAPVLYRVTSPTLGRNPTELRMWLPGRPNVISDGESYHGAAAAAGGTTSVAKVYWRPT